MKNSSKDLSVIQTIAYSVSTFLLTIVFYSIVYAAWNANMIPVTSGDALSSNSWNAIVENIGFINGKTASASCPAGKFVSGFDTSGGAVCSVLPAP